MHYTITVWSGPSEHATKKEELSLKLHSGQGTAFTLWEALEAVNEGYSEGKAVWLSVGAEYGTKHNAEHLEATNAIVLTYHASAFDAVHARLQELGLYALIVGTRETAKAPVDRITVIVPCNDRIHQAADHTRLSNLLLLDIGVAALAPESQRLANTYLFCMGRESVVLELDSEATLDVAENLLRRDYTKAADFLMSEAA